MDLLPSLLDQIQDELAAFCPSPKEGSVCLEQIHEIEKAIKYPLKAGGKRIRPLIVLLTAGAMGGDQAVQTARKSALAIELVHTYSLVHDDLPCMDNDDFRRGMPTTHKVYGEAKGLLVGDALLTQAFLLISQTKWNNDQDALLIKELVQTLAKSAGAQGMIWGQWLDMSLMGPKNTATWEQLETIHRNKTGKLLGASFELGLLCAGRKEEKWRDKIRHAGVSLGLAFQIIDDILDVTKSSQDLGKTAQKDLAQEKVTAVSLLGLEKAREQAEQLTQEAISILNAICPDTHRPYKDQLLKLVDDLLSRQK